MDADKNPRAGQPADPDDRLARPSACGWSAADDDLDEGLVGLALVSTNRLSLEEVLTRVATFAVQAIPGADGAGLIPTQTGRADTMVPQQRSFASLTTFKTASVRDRASLLPPKSRRSCRGP
jgi:hypothetical protein